MGIIEEIPEKGIVKYAKPVGVIAALVPVTNAALTEAGTGIFAIKAQERRHLLSASGEQEHHHRDRPHHARGAASAKARPRISSSCIEKPSIPVANELMASCDLTVATGGPAMVKAAYSSGKPAYGVGAGNATMADR